MSVTAIAADDHDPRPTATAPVGATSPLLPRGAVIRHCHEGLLGYKARRDSLHAEHGNEAHLPVLNAFGPQQGQRGRRGEGALVDLGRALAAHRVAAGLPQHGQPVILSTVERMGTPDAAEG